MKKLMFRTCFLVLITFSCTKNKCAECHYDAPSGEIELGTYCGDELKNLEALGTYTDSSGVTYVVHCGEH